MKKGKEKRRKIKLKEGKMSFWAINLKNRGGAVFRPPLQSGMPHTYLSGEKISKEGGGNYQNAQYISL